MKTESGAVNLSRGLSLLMMHERPRYFIKPEHCQTYVNPFPSHPFGLDVPPREVGMGSIRINFVGARATDMSVEAFLVYIRQWGGYVDGQKITKLRVINMPERQGENFVFFEIWSTGYVIISGETTDFSGAGNTARQELEDVFAVLAHIYSLTIERVQLNGKFPIERLYGKQTS